MPVILAPFRPTRVNIKHYGELTMSNHVHCNNMKLGEVYACSACGLELEVVNSCNHEGHDQCCDACADELFTCCNHFLCSSLASFLTFDF